MLRPLLGSFRRTIEERQTEFFHRLAARVNEHESRLSDLENGLSDLAASERSASATCKMLAAFLQSHDEDKKRALINAATNALLDPLQSELEENEFLEFLMLPSFNVYHLRLLRLFSREEEGPMRSGPGGSLKGRIEKHRDQFPLGTSDDTLRKSWDDLTSRRFLDGSGLTIFMTGSSVAAKHTTELGDRFLMFIDR